MYRRGRSDQIYSTIKRFTGYGKIERISNEIKDNKGDMLTGPVEKNRWKQYIEELYTVIRM